MPRGDGLIPKDISKYPNHLELSAKGGRAKSKAKTLANQLKGMKTATDVKKIKFYETLCSDPKLSELELLRISRDLFPTLEKEFNKVTMIGHFINIHKAIHGEKLKTENVHHVVHWDSVIGDILGTGHDETEKSDKEVL